MQAGGHYLSTEKAHHLQQVVGFFVSFLYSYFDISAPLPFEGFIQQHIHICINMAVDFAEK